MAHHAFSTCHPERMRGTWVGGGPTPVSKAPIRNLTSGRGQEGCIQSPPMEAVNLETEGVVPAAIRGPEYLGGYPVWAASGDGVEIRFVGRGLGGTRSAILARVLGREMPVAEAKQVHSDSVLVGREGFCGHGDALWTDRARLALSVITADCVPLVLAGGGRLAVVHAGWRGVVAGVVERAVETLGVPAGDLAGWIGPAIGVCCYEVGEEVAEAVTGASDSGVVAPGTGREGRPHLDLAGAVRRQLVRAGVAEPRVLVRCTRCDPERLWSYRREGKGVGRNVAYAWITDEP